MNLRRVAPFLFAALCLGLFAFVLRGQITSRPMPRPTAFEPHGPSDGGTYGDDKPADPAVPIVPSRPAVPTDWRVAAGPVRRKVMATVNDQLAAIQVGDADRAWFYQSRGLRRNFPSAQAFLETISRGYPEFGHAASASFGPVLTDAAGVRAGVPVTVRGKNGRLAPAYYWLIHEDGAYKVAGVEGGTAINEASRGASGPLRAVPSPR